jgi:nucleotide-binding universal stress UspA family protein
MTTTILLCTDGSDLAEEALRAGVRVLARPDRYVVATIVSGPSPDALVDVSGMAGATMTLDEFDARQSAALTEGEATVAHAIEALGVEGAETRIVQGEPGPAVCDLADELDADAIVLGSHGRRGIRRALLGSVSDHVVRHAGRPVVVVSPRDD